MEKEGPNSGGERLFVVKIGGNVIDNDDALESFLKNFASVVGKKILVHGGGKIATRIGDKLGITSNYINGRRITDSNTIDLVTMVYGGLVNKKMVARLQSLHCNAMGLTGADANLIPAQKRPVKDIDYGWVGDVSPESAGATTIDLLLAHNIVPVFAPLTHNSLGQILNTNADTIASALAIALSQRYKVRLIYCFEKKGILTDINDEQSVLNTINSDTYKHLLAEGKLFEGIIPKIDNAFAAINAGVNEVVVGHADDLLGNTSDRTTGSLFIK